MSDAQTGGAQNDGPRPWNLNWGLPSPAPADPTAPAVGDQPASVAAVPGQGPVPPVETSPAPAEPVVVATGTPAAPVVEPPASPHPSWADYADRPPRPDNPPSWTHLDPAPAAEPATSGGWNAARTQPAAPPAGLSGRPPAWSTVPASPQPTPPSVVPSGSDRFRLPLGVIVALVVALLAGGIFVVVRFTSAPKDGGASTASGSTADGSAQGGGRDSGPVVDPARVGPLLPVSVRATCQADPGVDSVGNTITYEPDLTLDAVPATAWRCPGSAVGHQLVYDFGAPVTLKSVGLVPGYAKVDPVDGSDRFAENRTVTAVTWRFDDGTTHRQTISSPGPSLVTVDLPRAVSTSEVVLEIAGTGNEGAIRDFTAVSDVRFAGY